MPDSDLLLSFLTTRDAPCPVCSYNLRGLQSPTCPECAAELHLQVGSDNVRLGPWLLGIISMALAVGFDAVITIIITVGLVFFFKPRSPADVRQMATTLSIFGALTLMCGAGIIILIRRRRQWCLARLSTQWRIAFSIFFVVGITHAVIGAFMLRMF